jgi:crotonobetainyl-CoA:carnitine CoA-transferase CaiB-like acyl-CoA transferase
MGAEVIKVEAPGRGDPGRASELHTVLGQAKRSIVLDLKTLQAVDLARQLAAASDVLIENFATGVMDRLGLGAAALMEINPRLIYVSASGLGRSGPEAHAVAYGTLLQCYAGFAGLNRHPDVPPRAGLAWLDPMCGLMLAFITAAALWQRRHHGNVARVDFSMLEGMLWTMAEPVIAAQIATEPQPLGNRSEPCVPHGAYRWSGDDVWFSLAVANEVHWQQLCDIIPALSAFTGSERTDRLAQSESIDRVLAAWARPRTASAAAAALMHAGVPAAALSGSGDLAGSEHLRERGFWDAIGAGVVPGLPWRASFGRVFGPAPALGADTEAVLRDVLGLSPTAIDICRDSGAFGRSNP